MQWARTKNTGFTIVELLIVVVVIAILAAITIVSYNGISNRTHEAAVQSDMSGLAKKMEEFKTVRASGSYPSTSELSQAGIRISKGSYLADNSRNNFYYCVSADGQSYAFGIVTKTGKGFILSNGKAEERSPSSTYQSNTCQAVGYSNGDTGVSGYLVGGGWQRWVNG